MLRRKELKGECADDNKVCNIEACFILLELFIFRIKSTWLYSTVRKMNLRPRNWPCNILVSFLDC